MKTMLLVGITAAALYALASPSLPSEGRSTALTPAREAPRSSACTGCPYLDALGRGPALVTGCPYLDRQLVGSADAIRCPYLQRKLRSAGRAHHPGKEAREPGVIARRARTTAIVQPV